MPDRVRRDRGVIKCPDFVLGDRHGTSCDNTFTQRASFLLREMGYQVALNDPYKGVEIVRRYGQPRHSQHALQLEINRRLYMDEKTLEKTSNFKLLQQDLTKFVRRLTEDVACGIVDVERLAAE